MKTERARGGRDSESKGTLAESEQKKITNRNAHVQSKVNF